MASLIERYTNKRVSFKFSGVSLELDLSQGLFSSFDVDAGTKFLLKAVAQQVDLTKASLVADMGCGTGVIGIAVAKKNAGSTCVFQDRDALALAFARSNCLLNGVEDRALFVGGLGLQAAGAGSFDLILSNLPAKAGLPVLSQLIAEMATRLKPHGVAGVVIVATLADEIGRVLHRLGAEVFHTEEQREHRVYLFRRSADSDALLAAAAARDAGPATVAPQDAPPAPAAARDASPATVATRDAGPAPAAARDASPALAATQHGGSAAPACLSAGYFAAYLRGRAAFSHSRVSYDLDTAYNLPDFDTLGRETSLAMDLIDKRLDTGFFSSRPGPVLIWNPGQGHAAVYLSKRFQNLQPGRFILASRDALSLEITRRNLTRSFDPAAGAPRSTEKAPASFHVASMDALCEEAAAFSKKVNPALLFLEPVPGAGREEEAALLVQRMLSPGGTLVASAGSTVIHRLLSILHGMVLHGSRKYHGSRAVILKKTV